jgi:regulator of protease activity HflC (stomatin/prohibitin superfamily)
MTLTSKRAEYVSVAALVLSIVLFGINFFFGRWSQSLPLTSISCFLASAALIWFVLWLQFHTRSLAEQEKLDATGLLQAPDGSKIFETPEQRAGLFAVAQRRLEIFEKYFLPLFSALIAVYQVSIGIYLVITFSPELVYENTRPGICAICMAATFFFCFLISRYASGMSSQLYWKPLRAGGSILLGIAVLCFGLMIGFALAHFRIFWLVYFLTIVVPVLLILLGAETALNIVLDFYRPRVKGQYSRSAFDSRLLGVISEPGGIFHSLAAAIDYQFGFKVSQTWFYRLLERAIFPLSLFGAAVLYLSNCFVFVAPDQQVIVERFGNPLKSDGQVRLLNPGVSLKWPWPVDIAYKYPTKKIMELNIGFVPKIDPKTKKAVREPLLWGKTHYQEEFNVLVASEHLGQASAGPAVPVTLLKANVPVQYRIKDIYSYIYNHKEPGRVLEAICYRQLAKFAASAKVEVDTEADLEQSLLGAGRAQAKEVLTSRIQQSADEAGLGVEIVFVGLQGIHPPPEVAKDYQKVVGAVQEKQVLVLVARAVRNKVLGTLVGSVQEASEICELVSEYIQAEEKNDEQKVQKLGKKLDDAFAQAGGEIFKTLKEAQSYSYQKAITARAAGERFVGQLKAYKAAPQIYTRQQRLSVLEESLEDIRKYVVVADVNDVQVFIVDMQDKPVPSLYDITGFEERSKK